MHRIPSLRERRPRGWRPERIRDPYRDGNTLLQGGRSGYRWCSQSRSNLLERQSALCPFPLFFLCPRAPTSVGQPSGSNSNRRATSTRWPTPLHHPRRIGADGSSIHTCTTFCAIDPSRTAGQTTGQLGVFWRARDPGCNLCKWF